jgi:OOP family OmpA-OmpF porin
MKTKLVAATSLAAITAMSAAHAEDFDKRWHANVMASFAYADGDRDRTNNPDSGQPEPSLAAGEGLGWHLSLGRSISDQWDLDLTLERGELASNEGGNTEIDQYGLGVQGTYFFNRGKIAPYLVTGFGMFRTNIDTNADGSEESLDGLKYDLGVGVQAKVGKSGASVKADARYRVDFYQDTSSDYAEYGDFVVNLGLQLPFGEKQEKARSCDHGKHSHDHAADTRWYWTPSVGYVFADSDRINENDGNAYSLAIGRQINTDYNLEVRLGGMNIDLEPAVGADTEIDKNSLTVELQRYFSRNEAFAPYIGVGVGAIRTQVAGVNTSYPAAEAAIGFATQVTDNGTSVKAEARYQFDAFDDAGTAGVTEYGDWIVGVGLQVPFGDKPNPKATSAYDGPVSIAVIDSDRDGIADANDACPGTAAGQRVDAVGCALVAVAPTADVPADNKPETVVVYFGLASAELTDQAKSTLNGIVNTMVQRRYIVAVATGFTDTSGEASYNVDLSRKRANAVKAYLIERGVRNANVIAKGKGENPSNNDTVEGRKMNRRVEVRLLDQ